MSWDSARTLRARLRARDTASDERDATRLLELSCSSMLFPNRWTHATLTYVDGTLRLFHDAHLVRATRRVRGAAADRARSAASSRTTTPASCASTFRSV